MWRGHSHSLTWLIFCMAKPRTKPGTLKTPDMHQHKLQVLHLSINTIRSPPLTLGLRALDCQCHSRQQGGHHRRRDREPLSHRWFNPFLHHQTLKSFRWVHFALLSLQVCCLFGQEVPWAHSQGQVKAQIQSQSRHPLSKEPKGILFVGKHGLISLKLTWIWRKGTRVVFYLELPSLEHGGLGIYWFSERR